MKVAHIINSMGTGGAENLIAESVSVFKNQGVAVDVILLNGTTTPFLNKLSTNGCTPVILGMQSVYNPLLIFKIIPLLKKYDIVHVHLFPALYWVALAKWMSFSKIKLVFTEHSTSNRRRNSIVFQIIDQFIYSFYTKIITISDDVDLAIKKSTKSNLNKFILIKNGINLKLIESGKVYNDAIFEKQGNKKFLIQVSSFQYPKDQKTLIKSLLHLPSKFSLFLVGNGILRPECEGLVNTLNLQSRVHFLGIRMDIANLLQTADFIVLSSHHEGLSLASIEGLASGKPFIASDVPGLHEVVAGAGLLFEDGDYKALAQHILHLDTNLDFYNQTVKNCLKRASEFDIEIMVQKQIQLYKTLII